MMHWLHEEYISLARELADSKKLPSNPAEHDTFSPQMLMTRRFVLDRLAELLDKKEELETEYSLADNRPLIYSQFEPSQYCHPTTAPHLSSGDWDSGKSYSQYCPQINGQFVDAVPAIPNNTAICQNISHNITRRTCSPVPSNNAGDNIYTNAGVSRYHCDEHTLYASQQVPQDTKIHLHQPYITDPNSALQSKVYYQPHPGGQHYNENFLPDSNISYFPAKVKPSQNRFQEPENQKPYISPLPPRSFCGETIQVDQKSVKPVHDHGPLVSKCTFNSDVGASKTLWAVTRINIFPDDSRTYEVMKVTDDQPCTIPNSTDSVFVFVSSNTN